MDELKFPDFFIDAFRTIFGAKANFYACLVAFGTTKHGREAAEKFVDFIKAGIAGLKTPEGQKLIEEYRKAFPYA